MTRPEFVFYFSNNTSADAASLTPERLFYFLSIIGVVVSFATSHFISQLAIDSFDDRFDVLPRQKKPREFLRERLESAGLYDQTTQNEIKRRGKLGDHFAWVLLQLHDADKLTDRVKKALCYYKLETLEQCIIAIINFSGNTVLTRQKRYQLQRYLSNPDFYALATLLLKYQSLSSSHFNQLIQIIPRMYPNYRDIFALLDKYYAISGDIFLKIIQLGTGMSFSYFRNVLQLLDENRNRLITKTHIDQLLSTPWLFTESAWNAIWLKVNNEFFDESEFLEIITRARAAEAAGHEPRVDDFRDQSGRMSPPFVFFATPKMMPSVGRNAELLADFKGEIPDEFCCSCSGLPMTDPVRIVGQPNSHVFEREWIQHWISTKSTNPMTNLPLDKKMTFVSAVDVSEKIEAFVADHGNACRASIYPEQPCTLT